MRPQTLDALVGQKHFLNPGFEKMLQTDRWVGLIFWGPPGTGKTTLARVIANQTGRPFESKSAVTSGVKELREIMERSKTAVQSGLPASILFIDEVHRLNKAQQDVLLPFLESGAIRFIGATTENPSFEINNAICSRSVIYHFDPLKEEDLLAILKRACATGIEIDDGVLEKISSVSLGDARRALTLLEHLRLSSGGKTISLDDFKKLSHSQSLYYDKHSESHYDTISAFIKSVRGSDPDAALYYLARMLEGGEDPKFIARRLIILASEDVGNASPMGLVMANSAFQAVHQIGMPEGRIILAQVTTFLACCEKSNRSYKGINEAQEKVKETGALDIPYQLRNAVTSKMKEWGYGKDYQYAHNHDDAWVNMEYLPKEISKVKFYEPSDRGHEKKFAEFLKKRKGSEKDADTNRGI